MSNDDTPIPRGYRMNRHGDLIREANIPEVDRDMDATVRHIMGFAADLSAQMYRFRVRTTADIYDFLGRVAERYGAKRGGRKGNVTLTTFDGMLQVQLAQSELVEVGPEVEAAQAIIEECIDDWSRASSVNLRALVDAAFRPDAATGRLSAAALLRLRRVEIDDARWRRAQDAITDALRPAGRSEYIRLYRRPTRGLKPEPVSLHLATVQRPPDDDFGETGPVEALARRVRSAVVEARHCGLSQSAIRETLLAAMRLRPANPGAQDEAAEADPS